MQQTCGGPNAGVKLPQQHGMEPIYFYREIGRIRALSESARCSKDKGEALTQVSP